MVAGTGFKLRPGGGGLKLNANSVDDAGAGSSSRIGRVVGSVSKTLGGDELLIGEFKRLNPDVVDIDKVRADRDYVIPSRVADADAANENFQIVARGWERKANLAAAQKIAGMTRYSLVDRASDSNYQFVLRSNQEFARSEQSFRDEMAAKDALGWDSSKAANPYQKAGESALGMVTSGLGFVAGIGVTGVGVATAGGGGILIAGYGVTLVGKSATDFSLNAYNLYSAAMGNAKESAYVPSSAAEYMAEKAGGGELGKRAAVAADMAFSLPSIKLLPSPSRIESLFTLGDTAYKVKQHAVDPTREVIYGP